MGIAREILQVWLFFSINWIPVGITASLGLANVSAPVAGVTLHLLSLSGLSMVAAVLFWTGRYCYTRTLGNVRIADAAVQSIMIGGVYGLLIAVYSFISTASISPQATVSSGGLGVNVGGSLAFGASPLEAFAVATVWGVLFSGCGILSHHVEGRSRATAMVLNLVPSARAWLTSTSSVFSSWAVTQLLGVGVMTAGGLAFAADSQLHHLTSVSNLSTFPLLFCVAALLGSNLTAGGFLGGMGMPMTLSTGGSAQFGLGIAGLGHVTPILVIGQVFFSLEVFLALFVASTTTARLMHADTSRGRIALMIATPFAVLMAVLSSVALPRFGYAGKTFGLTTTSSIAVVGIAFVEAFLIANLGVWWYRRGRRVWTPHLVSRFVYTGAEIRETLDSQVPSSGANTGYGTVDVCGNEKQRTGVRGNIASMKLSDWARAQGVHPKTAYRWWREGTLPVPARQINARTILVEEPKLPDNAGVGLYARVSSHDQRADLDRQMARLAGWAAQSSARVVRAESEVGSGMNGSRAKVRRMLADPAVTTIVVEHRDRLGRMNTEMVEAALSASGRHLVVLDTGEVTDDLVRDMTEVLTSFCARLYGRRSAKNRAEKALRCAEHDVGPAAFSKPHGELPQ